MSRTKKTLKNSKVALIFYFAYLVLQFISRKFFIDHLGPDILGLNTTMANILSFLNIVQLGIGGAVSFSLYKPLHQHNYVEINEIISLQGWFYRKIGIIISVISIVILFFFPLFFSKEKIPQIYIYLTFIVLLINVLSSYFINYTQILIIADQKEYKLTLINQVIKIVKTILQIVCIINFTRGYDYWLALEALFSFVTIYLIDKTVRENYPYLQVDLSMGKVLLAKHKVIIHKIKQLFTHYISQFILNQALPLIVYYFLSFTVVAIYGNYMVIINGLLVLTYSLFSGMQAGIGNLVAEGEKSKILLFFGEYSAMKFFLVSVLSITLYLTGQSFVKLWVGENYVLDDFTFTLFVIYLFVIVTRVTDDFINAYGLFSDVKAQIFESIFSLVLMIVLGKYYGLKGIMFGIIVSQFLMMYCWKPYYLLKFGFKVRYTFYFKKVIIYLFSTLISFIIVKSLFNFFQNCFSLRSDTFFKWTIYTAILFSLIFVINYIFYLILSKDFRLLNKRLIKLIKNSNGNRNNSFLQ